MCKNNEHTPFFHLPFFPSPCPSPLHLPPSSSLLLYLLSHDFTHSARTPFSVWVPWRPRHSSSWQEGRQRLQQQAPLQQQAHLRNVWPASEGWYLWNVSSLPLEGSHTGLWGAGGSVKIKLSKYTSIVCTHTHHAIRKGILHTTMHLYQLYTTKVKSVHLTI